MDLLDRRTFAWAVGVEDTFIPQIQTRTGRVLDEYELTQHYRFWREDLRRVAALGVPAIRYGIPWYRVNPAPGVFDWSFPDAVMPFLREVGLEPIVDLMHYGCPLWLDGTFLNPSYPERVAEYAAAFAGRYSELARLYTPLNEPLVNAHFSGRSGLWPPHRRGSRGYTAVTLALTRGIALTVPALRAAQPDAVMVHVEAAQAVKGDETVPPDDLERARERQFLATDLVLGRVDDGHAYTPWLLEHGASPDALAWHREHPVELDVLGVNFYSGLSCWRFSAATGRTVRHRFRGTAGDLGELLHRWDRRYARPLMVTETSEAGSVARRRRWLDDSLAAVADARAAGVDVRGYTWFPVFSHISWNWRGGRRPLAAYWTHMGLWDLHDDGNGTLERVETPLVPAYAERVAAGAP